MKKRTLALVIAALSCAASVSGQMTLPRELEIEVAKSALPAHLRDAATVYVLKPETGFVVAQVGSNGFHALVSRVEPAIFRADWAYVEHFNDVLLPIAFDATGARSSMRPFLEAAELMARGWSPLDLKREMATRFESGHYRAPDRPGVAFMLSPILRAFPTPYESSDRFTLNVPHRMFYAPNISNDDIGASPRAPSQPVVIQEGPWGYMIQRAGPVEREQITTEFREMLARLCALHRELCLPERPQVGTGPAWL